MTIKTYKKHSIECENSISAGRLFRALIKKCKESGEFDERTSFIPDINETFRKNGKEIIRIECLVMMVIIHIYDNGEFEGNFSEFEEDLLNIAWDEGSTTLRREIIVDNEEYYLVPKSKQANREERRQKTEEAMRVIANDESVAKRFCKSVYECQNQGISRDDWIEIDQQIHLCQRNRRKYQWPISKVPNECKFLFIFKAKDKIYPANEDSITAAFGFITALYSTSEVERRFQIVNEQDPNLFDEFITCSDAIIIERGIENPNIWPICKASGKPVYFYDGYNAMYVDLPILHKTLEKHGLI